MDDEELAFHHPSSDARNPSLNKLLAHDFACAEEAVLDRAERQSRHIRYLVIAHVI